MGILKPITEWATSPWGQSVPIHIAWFLIWVAALAGLLFLIVHAIYIRYFAKAEEFAGQCSAHTCGCSTGEDSQTLAGGTFVSLGYGSLDVHAAFYCFPPQSRCPV